MTGVSLIESILQTTRLNPSEVLARYKATYKVGDEISYNNVIEHVELEYQLTKKLKESTSKSRWTTFSDAYTQLYQDLPWLAQTGAGVSRSDLYCSLLKEGSRILEVGSGAGGLIRELALQGFDCVGTEVSERRGKSLVDDPLVTWSVSDGVNLEVFHPKDSFDYVISDQLVEHLHPDDIYAHCNGAFHVLKKGGSYFIRTPHRSVGPSDLSRVLAMNAASFMHLHEYNYAELAEVGKKAGFSKIKAVMYIPGIRFASSSVIFYRYMSFVDWAETHALKLGPKGRRLYRSLARFLLVAPNVWIQLEK